MNQPNSHLTSLWSGLFSALGAWQGMTMLGPVPTPCPERPTAG